MMWWGLDAQCATANRAKRHQSFRFKPSNFHYQTPEATKVHPLPPTRQLQTVGPPKSDFTALQRNKWWHFIHTETGFSHSVFRIDSPLKWCVFYLSPKTLMLSSDDVDGMLSIHLNLQPISMCTSFIFSKKCQFLLNAIKIRFNIRKWFMHALNTTCKSSIQTQFLLGRRVSSTVRSSPIYYIPTN